MAAPARERRAREGPGLHRVASPDDARASDEARALAVLVDDLAVLAADLWFSGKLDAFPPDEDAADEDE